MVSLLLMVLAALAGWWLAGRNDIKKAVANGIGSPAAKAEAVPATQATHAVATDGPAEQEPPYPIPATPPGGSATAAADTSDLPSPLVMAKHQRGTAQPERVLALYDLAWRLGQADHAAGRGADAAAHVTEARAFPDVLDAEPLFLRGYEDGYGDRALSAEAASYDQDYRQGLRDAAVKRPAALHSRGYEDAYQGRVHAFGRPY